jgi:hypothetical protein
MILNTSSMDDLRTYAKNLPHTQNRITDVRNNLVWRGWVSAILGIALAPTIIVPIALVYLWRKDREEFLQKEQKIIREELDFHQSKFKLLRNMNIQEVDLDATIRASRELHHLYLHINPKLTATVKTNLPPCANRILMTTNAQHLVETYFILHDIEKADLVVQLAKEFSREHRREVDLAFQYDDMQYRNRIGQQLDEKLTVRLGVSFDDIHPIGAAAAPVVKAAPETSEKTPLLADQAPPAYAEIYPSLDSANLTAVLPYNPAMS